MIKFILTFILLIGLTSCSNEEELKNSDIINTPTKTHLITIDMFNDLTESNSINTDTNEEHEDIALEIDSVKLDSKQNIVVAFSQDLHENNDYSSLVEIEGFNNLMFDIFENTLTIIPSRKSYKRHIMTIHKVIQSADENTLTSNYITSIVFKQREPSVKFISKDIALQNRNYLLKISYPLEIAIKKRDYTKIFHLSDKRGIRIASDGLILDPKYIKYLDSIEDIKYFFDRLFPKEIIEELKAGKHFEIYLFPEHNYPFRYRHRLSLGNNYSFLDDDGFIFDSHLVPIANFEQANMKYSEAQQYIRKDKELIKLENNLHMKKSLIKTASLSIKESDKIYETYSNTTNACIDKPEIKSCLRKVYMQNILDIESFIENRKKIFKIQNIKEVYNTIPKKFTISDRYYFTFQSPPLNEEKLAIELSNNPLTYFGTVLPNFKEHWVGRHNPTVQNVRELVHIFSLKDVIPDSNNGYYNAIIVKARGNKNKFLLAHVSDNSDPGGRIPDHMDPNYLNEFKFDLDENSEYVYVFEMAVIESQ